MARVEERAELIAALTRAMEVTYDTDDRGDRERGIAGLLARLDNATLEALAVQWEVEPDEPGREPGR